MRLRIIDEVEARGARQVQEWRQASEMKNRAATHPSLFIPEPQRSIATGVSVRWQQDCHLHFRHIMLRSGGTFYFRPSYRDNRGEGE